jgi:hypothetical protein
MRTAAIAIVLILFILFGLGKIGTFPLCKGFGLDFCDLSS